MSRQHEYGLVTTELKFNGEVNVAYIYQGMLKMFGAMGGAYASKTNRGVLNIRYALSKANDVIYREALIRAPVIRPEIHRGQQESRKDIHIGDRKYMIARNTNSKKWQNKGIIARSVVTFKDPVSTYAAALEFGRDEFLQVVEKKKHGVVGGQTSYWVRHVGAMKAQPFLREAQASKAPQALNVFASTLQKRWLTTLKRLNKNKRP